MRSFFWISHLLIGFSFLTASCADEEEVGGCTADNECGRGKICEESTCVELPCEGLNQCPGSGRTCLADLRLCSPQECGEDIEGQLLTCDDPARPACIEEGLFRSSCVTPIVACDRDEDCGNCSGSQF